MFIILIIPNLRAIAIHAYALPTEHINLTQNGTFLKKITRSLSISIFLSTLSLSSSSLQGIARSEDIPEAEYIKAGREGVCGLSPEDMQNVLCSSMKAWGGKHADEQFVDKGSGTAELIQGFPVPTNSHQWGLTAAHCVDEMTGMVLHSPEALTDYVVEKAFVPVNYFDDDLQDYALLLLRKEDSTPPGLPLKPIDMNHLPKGPVVVAGYGKTGSFTQYDQETLVGDTPLQSEENIRRAGTSFLKTLYNRLSYDFKKDNKDLPCVGRSGDSGGAVIDTADGTLIGIHTWSPSPAYILEQLAPVIYHTIKDTPLYTPLVELDQALTVQKTYADIDTLFEQCTSQEAWPADLTAKVLPHIETLKAINYLQKAEQVQKQEINELTGKIKKTQTAIIQLEGELPNQEQLRAEETDLEQTARELSEKNTCLDTGVETLKATFEKLSKSEAALESAKKKARAKYKYAWLYKQTKKYEKHQAESAQIEEEWETYNSNLEKFKKEEEQYNQQLKFYKDQRKKLQKRQKSSRATKVSLEKSRKTLTNLQTQRKALKKPGRIQEQAPSDLQGIDNVCNSQKTLKAQHREALIKYRKALQEALKLSQWSYISGKNAVPITRELCAWIEHVAANWDTIGTKHTAEDTIMFDYTEFNDKKEMEQKEREQKEKERRSGWLDSIASFFYLS